MGVKSLLYVLAALAACSAALGQQEASANTLPSESTMLKMAAQMNPYVQAPGSGAQISGNEDMGVSDMSETPMTAEFDPLTNDLRMTGMNPQQALALPYGDMEDAVSPWGEFDESSLMPAGVGMEGALEAGMASMAAEQPQARMKRSSKNAATPKNGDGSNGMAMMPERMGAMNMNMAEGADLSEMEGGEEAALEELLEGEAMGEAEGEGGSMPSMSELGGEGAESESEAESEGEGAEGEGSMLDELGEMADLEGEAEAMMEEPELEKEFFGDLEGGRHGLKGSKRHQGHPRHGRARSHRKPSPDPPHNPEPLPAHGHQHGDLGEQIKDIIAQAEAESDSASLHPKKSLPSHARIVKSHSDATELTEKTEREAVADQQAPTSPASPWKFLDAPKNKPQGRCEICSSIVMQKIHGAPIRCGSYVDRQYKLACEYTVRAMVTWGENVVSWLYTHGCTHEDADGYKVQVFPCPPAAVCGWIYGPKGNFCPVNPFYTPPWRQLPALPQAMNPSMLTMGRTHMMYKDKLTLKQRLALIKKLKAQAAAKKASPDMEMDEQATSGKGATGGLYESLVDKMLSTDEPARK